VQNTNIKGVKQAVASGLAVASGSKRSAPEASEGKQKKVLKVWGMEDMSDSDNSNPSDVALAEDPRCSTSDPESSRPSSDGATTSDKPPAVETQKEDAEQRLSNEAQAVEGAVAGVALPAGAQAGTAQGTAAVEPKVAPEPLDLSRFASAEELQSVGLDVLKAELQRHGLKAGGTLSQRAARLFLLRSTPLEKLDRALFAKK